MELKLDVGERSLRGTVFEKGEAEEQYEETITDGDTAILLQKREDGLYTINLGNLQAGEIAVIRFCYAELHQWQGEQLRFLLPTVIAERYGDPSTAGLQPHEYPKSDGMVEHSYQLSLRISGLLRQARLESPTHAIQTLDEGGTLLVQIAGNQAAMDRDFVLNLYRIAQNRERGSLVSGVDPFQDNTHVLMACFQSLSESADKHHPVSLKVLVDCSGSMAGDSIVQTRTAIEEILGRLQEGDEFSVTCFGSHIKLFKRGMLNVTPRSIEAGRHFVEKIDADLGGTELRSALTSTYGIQGRDKIASDILLITDGEVWESDEIYQEASASGHRIFTVGVGSAVSESFVRKIAQVSGGAAELVTPNEQMTAHIVRHFERIRAPEASIAIDWGVEVMDQMPSQIERVFAADTTHTFATTHQSVPNEIVVHTSGDEVGEGALHITADKSPSSITADTLARLAAWYKLKELDDREETVALALQYQLLTEYTSMSVVDVRESVDQANDLPEVRMVTQMRAAGWGGTGTVKFSLMLNAPPKMKAGNGNLDRPSFQRNERGYMKESSDDYLDIPTFMRTAEEEHFRKETPIHLASELNGYYQLWSIVNRFTSSWLVERLERFGLPNEVSMWLRSLVVAGYTEKQVVIHFLHAFIHSALSTSVERAAQRIIIKRYKRSDVVDDLHQQMVTYLEGISDNEWPKVSEVECASLS